MTRDLLAGVNGPCGVVMACRLTARVIYSMLLVIDILVVASNHT